MMKLKDMRMGTFKGMTALNKKDQSRSVPAVLQFHDSWIFIVNQPLSVTLPDPRLRQEKSLGRTGRCKACGGAKRECS